MLDARCGRRRTYSVQLTASFAVCRRLHFADAAAGHPLRKSIPDPDLDPAPPSGTASLTVDARTVAVLRLNVCILSWKSLGRVAAASAASNVTSPLCTRSPKC